MSRRGLLTAAAVAPLAANASRAFAQGAAQTGSAAPPAAGRGEVPPILFVHGNGDTAGIWITTLWRMESNGVARSRMAAINFADPMARTDDTVPQPGRSSTGEQRAELAEAVKALKARTGASRIALVGSSRGGNAIRNLIKTNGSGDVSHAVLCGTPNHGVYAWDDNLASEFNGRGPFLSGLNAGETEVVAGTAFLTLRSDGYDKFAQPDGRFVGKAGTPTNVTTDGPALKGATNLVLGHLDHREVAFHPRAFREIYKFIAGQEPRLIEITPESEVTIGGVVSATPGGIASNRPASGATIVVYHVSADTGERVGAPMYAGKTADDGRWGPAKIDPRQPVEIVLGMANSPTTHFYRSPFPRSSDIVNLRPGRMLGTADAGAGAVVIMARPRGYFGLPRDIVLLDGKEPTDVKHGVPVDSVTTARLPPSEIGRAVPAIFNHERIVARAWPASENRISVAVLTY